MCVRVCVCARAHAGKALVTNCGYKVSRTSLNGFVLLRCLAINTKLSPQFNSDAIELCVRCRPLFSVRHVSLFHSASKRGIGLHDLWWDWKYSCTQVQLHSSTAALKYSCTQVQLHSSIAALKYSCTQVQLHSSTAALKYSCTQVQLHSSTAALKYLRPTRNFLVLYVT